MAGLSITGCSYLAVYYVTLVHSTHRAATRDDAQHDRAFGTLVLVVGSTCLTPLLYPTHVSKRERERERERETLPVK